MKHYQLFIPDRFIFEEEKKTPNEHSFLFQHDTARRILDKIVQKVDDTDDTIPLAKVSLLIREKNLSEATQLLQVRDEK